MFSKTLLAALIAAKAGWAQAPKIEQPNLVAAIHASTCGGAIGAKLTPSGRITISCQTLQDLAHIAYVTTFGESDVEGGPKWAGSDRFDVVAEVDTASVTGWDRMPDNQRFDEVRLQLQQLLSERFRLKVHNEPRMEQGYALVQAKGGATLKGAAPPPPKTSVGPSEELPVEEPPAGSFRITNGHWIANAVQIPNILFQIAARAGYDTYPLIDGTGLKDSYSFDMSLPPDKDPAAFEKALKDQLGLLLESRRIPRTIYVIDSAEKPGLDAN